MTILKPFPSVPQESVTYLSVTKFVFVKSIPFSPIAADVSEQEISALRFPYVCAPS
jgi:hypothetical protein